MYKGYENAQRLQWCYEGQRVIAPYIDGQGIKCVVLKACGIDVLVANERYDFERWVDVQDLIADDSPPPPKPSKSIPLSKAA
jgi:hypothetical protein